MLKYIIVLLIFGITLSNDIEEYCSYFVADDGTNWSNPWAGVY